MGANGLAMLFAGAWWYGAVPGVVTTGPFNPHFVMDIGVAFLVTAAGLGWFAARPVQGWPAAVMGAAFLGLHALIHLVGAFAGGGHHGGTHHGGGGLADLIRDFPGVYLPALLAEWITARKPQGA
ncbi:MAG: hypothetical protein JWP35_259 [Caulobacter sp.]|nr:hypothetical protein [Caulobacter sp.]